MRLLTTFHQLETMHEHYHIFTSSPSCYASVMKQNVNSTILISKKDIARIVKTSIVKTVKLQAALPKRNFLSIFFLGLLFHKTALSDCMSNNYCCCTAVQGQQCKFTWINTVTSFKTLVKSHKGLKGTVVFAQRYLRKKLSRKFYKTESDETVMKSSFS